MAYAYVFSETALNELEDASGWYASNGSLVIKNFWKKFNVALAAICKYPLQWRNPYKHYHEFPVKNLPYSLIYTVDETEMVVTIVSVFHNKRNPRDKYPL